MAQQPLKYILKRKGGTELKFKYHFPKNEDIKRPIKIKFPFFKKKVYKRYEIIEDNFLKELDVYTIKLLFLFADKPYGTEKLVYVPYEKSDFRQMNIKLKYEEIKSRISQLENLGLIKVNEDGHVAYNYLFDSEKKIKFVKIPVKIKQLIEEKIIKRNEIKVLFALLLLFYSDCTNGVKNMGTNKKRITTSNISKLTGITRRSVRRNIKNLKQKKIIYYEAEKGKNNGNLYKIKYSNKEKNNDQEVKNNQQGINIYSKKRNKSKKNNKARKDLLHKLRNPIK